MLLHTDAPLALLVRKHATRYWIERSFQDGKTSVGMADYQARGWLAWHHHMALVILAMLFMLRQRIKHVDTVELLSCQDIVELLDAYLPGADRSQGSRAPRHTTTTREEKSRHTVRPEGKTEELLF